MFLGSLQNDGTGAINVVAGWDGTTLDPRQYTSAGVFGNNGGSIVIGGDQAQGNVAIGSAGGMTTLAAADVSLLANDGYAQAGYHGAGSGGIAIDASGTVALTGGGGGEGQRYAQIGNGGQGVSGNESGDIAITAGGDIVLTGGDGSEAYAQIGHGGADSNERADGYTTCRQHHAVRGQCDARSRLRAMPATPRSGMAAFMSGSQPWRRRQPSAATSPSPPRTPSFSPAMATTLMPRSAMAATRPIARAGAGSSASIHGNITVVASDRWRR